MPIRDGRNGNAFYCSEDVFKANRAGSNGAIKPQPVFLKPEDYGARFRATMTKPILQPSRTQQKVAFEFEAPARNSGMGAFKEEAHMRGRAKGAYNITAGYAGRRMTLTAPESGSPVEGVGQINRVDAPPEGYVEIDVGSIGMLGATAEEEAAFRTHLVALRDKADKFNIFTSKADELRVFQMLVDLHNLSKKLFEGTAKAGIITALGGEAARWIDDRQQTIQNIPGGQQIAISSIRSRVLNAADASLGILAAGPATTPVPLGVPAPTPAVMPYVAPAAPSWFQRNKTMVIGGVVLLFLGLGYAWYQKQR